MAQKMISMDEAAETYGVSRRTIRRYIAAGRITAYRFGPRLIRLNATEVAKELLGARVGGSGVAR